MKRKLFCLTIIIFSLLAFNTGFIKIDLTASFTFPDFPEKDTKYEMNVIDLLHEGTETEAQTETEKAKKKKKKKAEVQTEAQTEAQTETEKAKPARTVPSPKIDKQYLTKNEWSRPGDKVKKVEKIVIHYLGNPGSTAQENRDYFESLKDSQDLYMSSTFIVGLDGEIIQCLPEKEVAYCTKDANRTSISIETCHLDSTGKYLSSTYISMVKLTAYLTEKYNIGRKGIVRHYDCTGKACPRYFTDHPKAWKRFVNDVMKYRKLCKNQDKVTKKELKENLSGLKDTYTSKKAWKKLQKKKKN